MAILLKAGLLFVLLPALLCLLATLLLRRLLRRLPALRRPGTLAVLGSWLLATLLLASLREHAPAAFPINGAVEAGYVALLFHLPAVALLSWRA